MLAEPTDFSTGTEKALKDVLPITLDVNLARLFAGVFLKSLCLQLRDHLLAHWLADSDSADSRTCRKEQIWRQFDSNAPINNTLCNILPFNGLEARSFIGMGHTIAKLAPLVLTQSKFSLELLSKQHSHIVALFQLQSYAKIARERGFSYWKQEEHDDYMLMTFFVDEPSDTNDLFYTDTFPETD